MGAQFNDAIRAVRDSVPQESDIARALLHQIQIIKQRTAFGNDIDGNRFIAYSKAYKKRKADPGRVNLRSEPRAPAAPAYARRKTTAGQRLRRMPRGIYRRLQAESEHMMDVISVYLDGRKVDSPSFGAGVPVGPSYTANWRVPEEHAGKAAAHQFGQHPMPVRRFLGTSESDRARIASEIGESVRVRLRH